MTVVDEVSPAVDPDAELFLARDYGRQYTLRGGAFEDDPKSPHDVWSGSRSRSSVIWSPRLNAWLALSHEAVTTVFRGEAFDTAIYAENRPTPVPLRTSFELGPSEHDSFKRAVTRSLRQTRLVHVVADEIPSLGVPAGLVDDFAGQFAEPLMRNVTARLLGRPLADVDRLAALMRAATDEPDPSHRQAAGRVAAEHLIQWLREARAARADSLLGDLAHEGSQFAVTDEALAAFVSPMVFSLAQGIAGRLLVHAVWVLSAHPELHDVLLADGLGTARRLVLEVARLEPINQLLPRRLCADVLLGGQQLRQGDRLLVVVPAACRDESVFPAASRVDLSRDTGSLAFGLGRYFCLGRELAVGLAVACLVELFDRQALMVLPRPDRPIRIRAEFARACTALPVRLERKLPHSRRS